MKILIIGAGKGVGRTLAAMLAQRGHTVIAGLHSMNSVPDMEGYGQQKEDLEAGICKNGIWYLPMDVTNEQQMRRDAEIIEKREGLLDCVVSVAGILLPSDRTCSLLEEPIEDLRRQMDVNAIGLVAAFRTFAPHMKDGSRYFAVTSEGGSFILAGTLFPGYGVSKTAANKFVQVLRMTCGKDHVDLLAVHPGRVNTEMGRTTAQIEPEESAAGFVDLIEGRTQIDSDKSWFIDYLGRPMSV